MPFFPTMQASIAFIVYQQKANIFNFLQMAAKYGPTSSLPYRTNPKKAEPRSLCRLFPPHFQKLPTLVMNVVRMPNTPEWLHRFLALEFYRIFILHSSFKVFYYTHLNLNYFMLRLLMYTRNFLFSL